MVRNLHVACLSVIGLLGLGTHASMPAWLPAPLPSTTDATPEPVDGEQLLKRFEYPASTFFTIDPPSLPNTPVFWKQWTTTDAFSKVTKWYAETQKLTGTNMNGYGNVVVGKPSEPQTKLQFSVSNYPLIDGLREKKHYEGLQKSMKVGSILSIKEKKRTADIWIWTGKVTDPNGDEFFLNVSVTRGAKETATHVAVTVLPIAPAETTDPNGRRPQTN